MIYIYIWRKLIKNTLYCHPDYLSLIYHSPLFIPSDHEVDDLWLLCEQGVCGPGGSHQQSGGYQYKGRGWMKPLTFINFSLGSFFSWTINARNDYTIDTLKRFNRYYPGKFSHCPHFTTRSTRKMAFPFIGLLMEGHPIRQGLSGHWSHAEWTRYIICNNAILVDASIALSVGSLPIFFEDYQLSLIPILLPSKSNVLSQLLVILRWRLAKQVAGWTKPAVRDLEWGIVKVNFFPRNASDCTCAGVGTR